MLIFLDKIMLFLYIVLYTKYSSAYRTYYMKKLIENKKEKTSYTSLVPAVDDASRILISLAGNTSPRVNLTDICKDVGIHKSKGYSILSTLQKYGFVNKNLEDKTYSLGPGLISLSRKVLDNMDYRETVAPFLEKLSSATQSAALFAVIDDGNAFVVAKHEGDKNIGVTIRLGHRFSATAGAHGKAITAFMPQEEQKKILKKERLFFHGDASRLDRTRLMAELEECRAKGFAFDIGELNPGINAIASPVFNSKDELMGSLFIIGTFQETQVDEYGKMVYENARQVSRMLGARTDKVYGIVSCSPEEEALCTSSSIPM
jgi:DNA-binding IclR family transcriptional regulator